MVRFPLFGILLQGDKASWMTLTELCSQTTLGVSVGTCVLSSLGIIVLVLVVFVAFVSLTTWTLLNLYDRVYESQKRRVPRTVRPELQNHSEERFTRQRRFALQVDNDMLPHPITPLPRKDRRPPKDPLSASHACDGDPRSVDAICNKEVLEKRHRLKERKVNSADIIDPTALPGYFGDTNDLVKLLEHVEGQPVRGTPRAKPKKSTKKKGFRRRVENLPLEATANDVRSDSGVALDNEETVNEASLKDTKYDNSEEGSPARTLDNSWSSISGRKQLVTNVTSDIVYNCSDEISTNESGDSFSQTHLSESDGAPNDDSVLRPQRETTTNGQIDSVSPISARILESVTNNQSTQGDRHSTLKRPRPRDLTTHREDRSSQQFHFMSQIWNRFNDECDDYTTYVAASKSQ